VARRPDDPDRLSLLPDDPFSVGDLLLDRHPFPCQFEQIGNGALSVLFPHILHPAPLDRVNGHPGAHEFSDRLAPSDMVRMRVGQKDQRDLLWTSPLVSYLVKNQVRRGCDAGIDQTDLLADDQVRIDEPLTYRPSPRSNRKLWRTAWTVSVIFIVFFLLETELQSKDGSQIPA
jgi:hypothetical protein